MIGDVRFNDLVRVYQIRSKPKKSFRFQDRNRNFKEFTDVYNEILSDSLSESPKLKPCYVDPSRSRYGQCQSKKPLHDIKKIHLEMPVLGTEQAIISTPTATKRKPLKTKAEKRDQSLLTENRITKWGKKEPQKPKSSKDSLLTDTRSLLKQTKQEIAESTSQFEAIKSMINTTKPPVRIRKSRSPTYKAKKKSDRHSECMSKKYVSTLNTMQQKLNNLEQKYFSTPHIVYKNVRDICTTSSDIDFLYENNSAGNDDISVTLQGIKEELDLIANSCIENEEKKPKKTVTFKAPEVEFNTVGDTFDEDKTINPTNFSFKKPANFEDDLTPQERNEDYSKIIDKSENCLKKYFKHFDVAKFCQEICDLVEDDKEPQACEEAPEVPAKVDEIDRGSMTDESDNESHNSEVDHFYHEDKSVFFNKDMQEVISSSSYLTKEFEKPKPNVKVFFNTDNYLRGRYFGMPGKTPSSVEPSITDLIDNLSLCLKGSIYYKSDPQ